MSFQYKIYQHIIDNIYISYLIVGVGLTPTKSKKVQKKNIEILGIHLTMTNDFESFLPLFDDENYLIDDIEISNALLYDYFSEKPFDTWNKFVKYVNKINSAKLKKSNSI